MGGLLTLHELGLHTQAVSWLALATEIVLWLLTCCAHSYHPSAIANALRAVGTWRKVATSLVIQKA